MQPIELIAYHASSGSWLGQSTNGSYMPSSQFTFHVKRYQVLLNRGRRRGRGGDALALRVWVSHLRREDKL
jgi:hypothetical protein